MSYGLVFGTYTFSPGFHISNIEMARSVPAAKLPRADGARVPVGYLDAKKITIRGGMMKASLSTGSGAALRNQLDGLKGALAQGPASFYTDSDRFYRNCQASNYSDSFDPTGFNRIVTVEFSLISGDPFSYAQTGSTSTRVISASAQTQVATNAGNAYAQPAVSLTVGVASGGGLLACTLTNTTTGEVCTLAGAVTASDVFVIDSLNETVTRAGLDVTSYFEGVFPRMLVGANTFEVQYTAGTIVDISIAWNNRFF